MRASLKRTGCKLEKKEEKNEEERSNHTRAVANIGRCRRYASIQNRKKRDSSVGQGDIL